MGRQEEQLDPMKRGEDFGLADAQTVATTSAVNECRQLIDYNSLWGCWITGSAILPQVCGNFFAAIGFGGNLENEMSRKIRKMYLVDSLTVIACIIQDYHRLSAPSCLFHFRQDIAEPLQKELTVHGAMVITILDVAGILPDLEKFSLSASYFLKTFVVPDNIPNSVSIEMTIARFPRDGAGVGPTLKPRSRNSFGLAKTVGFEKELYPHRGLRDPPSHGCIASPGRARSRPHSTKMNLCLSTRLCVSNMHV